MLGIGFVIKASLIFIDAGSESIGLCGRFTLTVHRSR
jgi:hypothetical protein